MPVLEFLMPRCVEKTICLVKTKQNTQKKKEHSIVESTSHHFLLLFKNQNKFVFVANEKYKLGTRVQKQKRLYVA